MKSCLYNFQVRHPAVLFFINVTTHNSTNITIIILLFSLHFKILLPINVNLITNVILHLILHLFELTIYYKHLIRDLVLYRALLFVYNTF
jgi:hypothetical protein